MKQSFISFFCLMLSLTAFSNEIDKRYFNNSHDINSLLAWGPYSKRYAGFVGIEFLIEQDISKSIRSTTSLINNRVEIHY